MKKCESHYYRKKVERAEKKVRKANRKLQKARFEELISRDSSVAKNILEQALEEALHKN